MPERRSRLGQRMVVMGKLVEKPFCTYWETCVKGAKCKWAYGLGARAMCNHRGIVPRFPKEEPECYRKKIEQKDLNAGP